MRDESHKSAYNLIMYGSFQSFLLCFVHIMCYIWFGVVHFCHIRYMNTGIGAIPKPSNGSHRARRTHKCWYMRIYKLVHADFISFFNRFIMSAFAFTCTNVRVLGDPYTFITKCILFLCEGVMGLWVVGFTRSHTEITQFREKKGACAQS